MRLSHIYQPALIRSLVDAGGSATLRQLAGAFLAQDESQLMYYEKRIKEMPLKVLSKHGVVEKDRDLVSLTTKNLTLQQKAQIRMLCEQAMQDYVQRRGLSIWDYRLLDTEPVPDSVRYQILKESGGRCALCGATKRERPLDVDHIKPRSRGGTNDAWNLQVLCSTCNRSKRDKDETDFRLPLEAERDPDCPFCETFSGSRLVDELGSVVAITDQYPVTDGHLLVITRDEVAEKLIHNPLALEEAILAEEFINDADRDTLVGIMRNAEQQVAALKEERQRLLHQHQKGYLDDRALDEEMARVRNAVARAEDEFNVARWQLERPDEIWEAVDEATQSVARQVSFFRLFGEDFEREEFEFEQLPETEQKRIREEEPDHPYMKRLREIEKVCRRPAEKERMAEFYGDDPPYIDPRTRGLIVNQKRGILQTLLGPEGFISIRREPEGIKIELRGTIHLPQKQDPPSVFSTQSLLPKLPPNW